MYIWTFVIGALHVPVYAELWPKYLLLGFLSLPIVTLLAPSTQKYKKALIAIACFFSGMLFATLRLEALYASQLEASFEGQTIHAQIQVQSIPKRSEKSTSFLARVDEIDCGNSNAFDCPEIIGEQIRVSWFFADRRLAPGQVWALSLKLKRPRGLVNPGGFDYHAWLLSKEVVATASVRTGKDFERTLIREKQNLASHRENFRRQLLADGNYTFERVLRALLVGDRSLMNNDDWKLLQATGTVHLMAISGLHVGLVAIIGFGLGSLFSRTLSLFFHSSGARIFLYIPAAFSLSCAAYYAALAGFSIPTQRALVACVLVNAARCAGVKMPPERLLVFCLLAVCLIEPLAWVNVGFWLSFAAVFILMYSLVGRPDVGKFRATLNSQLVIFLGLLVPIVFLGQGMSLVSPLANLIAVPLMSLLIIPLLLLASVAQFVSPTWANAVLLMNDWLLAKLWALLEVFAGLPMAQWWPHQNLTWAVFVCGLTGSLLLLAPRAVGLRVLGSILLFCCAFGRFSRSEDFELNVLDVGQGLAVHFSVPGSHWLYDTGPRYPSGFDTGERIILPFLRRRGTSEISMIVSHDDSDHSGGAMALTRGLKVPKILAGEALTDFPSADYQRCIQGQFWQDQTLSFDVLWPPKEGDWEGNRASCVVLVTYETRDAQVTTLLTGDIDSYVERRIMHLLPAGIDVLIAPHHGSNSSSNNAFIRALNPRYVVFSTGYLNRFRHPGDKALLRYQKQGVKTLNTAEHGAITFQLELKGDLKALTARELNRRAWF